MRLWMVVASVGLLAAACDVHTPTGPGSPSSITVTPDVTLQVGQTQQFTAVATDPDGNVVSFVPQWSVVAGGGEINDSGMFTAGSVMGLFTATVTASNGAISGTATVTVIAGQLATIEVTPNPATVAVNQTQQFTAVGRDAGGNVVAITPTWAVVDGGGAIHSESGLFTAGLVAGTFNSTVEASSDGMTGSATVVVVEAIPGPLATIEVTPNPVHLGINQTQQFTAVGRDADGSVVAITPTWTVVEGGGAIHSGSGLFTAGQVAGTFNNTVEASSDGMTGSATVVVIEAVAGPLATIEVTPNPVSLAINQTQQFTAVGRDADGNVVAITPTWSVVEGGGAIDSGSGLFTAGSVAGTFNNTVEASSDGISGTATVEVFEVALGPLATIEVTPNPANLEINQTQQFIAVGRDADGNVVAITPTWAVVDGGGAIDSGSGLFTAGSVAGTFNNTVEASSDGISGTATVEVFEVALGPLATIEVTPNPANLEINQTQQFIAVGRDADGNVVAITPTWTVVDGGGAIHSGSGLFTAGSVAGTFNNTVEATSDGMTGSATVEVIDVVPGPLATIEVTPNPVSLEINQTQQFTAVGRDADGNVVAITPTWTVVDGGGAIHSGSGLFTAGSVAGTFNNTVEATSDGMTGSATVEVIAAPPSASPLNSAGNFGILAGAGIGCAISGSVTGAGTAADIGSSPTLTINGFGPCTFDGAIPAPAVVATAKGALTAAYLAAQGQVCDLDLTGVDLGFYNGLNPLPPGTYCFSTSVGLTGTLELAGSATDTWTFQIGSTLTAAVGSQVILSGGAIPDNVYWAVGSSATLNTNTAFQGNIMAQASITLQADVSLLGRALAQDGAVALINGGVSIVKP